MNNLTAVEIKENLSSFLQDVNISDSLISSLLTDDFINGLITLRQKNPENSEFITLIDNFSNEQSIIDIINLEETLITELNKNGYVGKLFQYIQDSWSNIIFPDEMSRSGLANIAQRAKAIGGAFVTIIKNSYVPQIASYALSMFTWKERIETVHNQQKRYYDIVDSQTEKLWEVANGIHNLVEIGEETRSPLVVDLDGDGVETVGTNNNIYFDHDGNGFAENTGWVGKDDGLLVRDINGNGQIDNGTELFGNNSVLSSGEKAANGFEALADLDSNNDGVFNSSDTAWNQVEVWKDANLNGYVDEGELLTLEQANVSGINLNYQKGNTQDENNNSHNQTGTFIKTDGSTGTVTDVWFDANMSQSVDLSDVEIPADIAALPNISGTGNVHDLHTAMALDTSGELKALVQQFAAETDAAEREEILLNIIYHWTGVQDMDPNGRNPTMIYGNVLGDSRKLEALEEFIGEEYLGTWCWGERDPNPHGKAAPYILRAFKMLASHINCELLSQTHYKSLLEKVKLTWNADTQAWDVNVIEAVSHLQELYTANADQGMAVFRDFEMIIKNMDLVSAEIYEAFREKGSLTGNSLEVALAKFGDTYGTAFDDELTGTAGAEVMNGYEGNDYIYGGGDNDTLNGDAGNDELWGGDGNDVLIGGLGNDHLVGGNSADTYHFEAGFGNDTIDNSDDDASATAPDVIEFGEGILPSKTVLQRQGFDLIIKVSYADTAMPADTVRVYSYFDRQGTTSATVNSIVFADGTSWDYEYVLTHWNSAESAGGGKTYEGMDEDDPNMTGTSYDDIMIGNGGNDRIQPGSGNDILIGGPGDDYLAGDYGNDTYIYNLGDGFDTILDQYNRDTILFGPGIAWEDLQFASVGNSGSDLRIIIKGNPNQGMVIQNFFSGTSYKIEDLKFADGSIVHLSEIPLTLVQDKYAESITGTEFNDTIIGGKGDDTFNSSLGDDVYVYNLGDGVDTISDSQGNNIIRFGEGISFNNLRFIRNDYKLIIQIGEDCTSRIYVNGTTSELYTKTLEFADGSSFSLTNDDITYSQSDKDDSFSITDAKVNITVYGNEGNDTIDTGNGNDIIIGGQGDDILNGRNGDDTYIYNLGDGFDTISDSNGNNKIQFGEGISLADLSFEAVNYKLNIYINGDKTQGISVYGDAYNSYGISEFVFADGSTYSLANGNMVLNQSDGNNKVNRGNSKDNLIVYGTNDADSITTGSGNDTIIGGQGDDTLDGYGGNDTYIYNLGDGFDTISDGDGNNKIKFGEGISLDDLTFTKDGYNLIVYFTENPSQGIKLPSNYEKYTLEFADGSSFSLANDDITYSQSDKDDSFSVTDAKVNITVYGNDGNDKINTGNGNDTIIGGQGDDTLNGYNGNDTYIYNLGDGFDTISDGSGNNKIKFGEGISLNDLNFAKEGYGLIIFFPQNPSQGIKLTSNYEKYTLEFADGTELKLNDNNLIISPEDYSTPINGTKNDDVLTGTERNDVITAKEGADIIAGGKGNDTIDGGSGADTYIYNLGDGFDIISDTSGSDTIKFGEGITMENLTFRQEGENLKIFINSDVNSGMQLNSFFYNPTFRFETFEFADGTSLKTNDLILTLTQTDESETIEFAYNDKSHSYNILAGGGNDKIDFTDAQKPCTITGGKGNDTIDGGTGADTYIYNLGDGFDVISDMGGSDTIKFGHGITMENLTFCKQGDDLKIIINNDINSGMLLQGFFYNSKFCFETFEFADGTSLKTNDLVLTLQQGNANENISFARYDNNHGYNIYAGDGNDKINLNYVEKDCIVSGGKGNDSVDGGSGNDTYIYNLGDGFDVISDMGGSDTIKFGSGITMDNLTFRKQGDDLKIIINNDINSGMLLSGFFSASKFKFETFAFSDGTSLATNNLALSLEQGNADDDISFYRYDSSHSYNVCGGDGNDQIDFNYVEQNCTVCGGKGNDVINGSLGDDTYIYNLGDGFDTISEQGGIDKIVLGEGISLNNLSFEKQGDDLRILINEDVTQGFYIKNQYNRYNDGIESIEFKDGSTLNISNADQLIQAMNSFSVSNSASTDPLSNPTEDVSDMYSLAASQDLTRKAI